LWSPRAASRHQRPPPCGAADVASELILATCRHLQLPVGQQHATECLRNSVDLVWAPVQADPVACCIVLFVAVLIFELVTSSSRQ
jgi:hypothetical protein